MTEYIKCRRENNTYQSWTDFKKQNDQPSFKFFTDPVIRTLYCLNVSVKIFAVFWRKGSNIAPNPESDVLSSVEYKQV